MNQAYSVLTLFHVALELLERDKGLTVQNRQNCCITKNDRPCNSECEYNIIRTDGTHECLHDILTDVTFSMRCKQ